MFLLLCLGKTPAAYLVSTSLGLHACGKWEFRGFFSTWQILVVFLRMSSLIYVRTHLSEHAVGYCVPFDPAVFI